MGRISHSVLVGDTDLVRIHRNGISADKLIQDLPCVLAGTGGIPKYIHSSNNVFDMKTLDLVLKKQWYDMIDSGEKPEEYREIKKYWVKRLLEPIDMFGRIYCKAEDFDNDPDDFWCEFIVPTDIRNGIIQFKDFDNVTFHLGYSKDRPSMTFVIKEIVCDEGKEEWGALPGETYFVIKLGDRL